jgi:poly-gamma-glutamate capsule biosynthesis protein CapA/YwtB (metallophosphatase superfamily)
VVGDIMLGRGVAGQPGGAAARLRALAPHLRASDLTVGNLESTLSDDGPPQQGTDSFSAAPAVLDALAGAGVDALSLANNHTGDHGDPALLETVAAFRSHRIESFGAGRDLRAATRAAVLTRNGLRFGFLGFNAIGETPRATPRTPGALSVRMPPRTGPLNRADLGHLVDATRSLAERVDVVVVLPHWGTQYTHVAEPVQSLVGRQLVDAGADLVVGGHPHWVQGLERYDGAVIAHSLGNLVFDMDFMEQTMEGVTLTARFRGDRLRGVELTPYRLDTTFTPRRVTGPAARAILRDVHTHDVGSDPGR